MLSLMSENHHNNAVSSHHYQKSSETLMQIDELDMESISFPIPPPFDPLRSDNSIAVYPPENSIVNSATGSNPHSAAEGGFNSVVPDLMRVYESLTQSSTPQQPPPPSTSASPTAEKGIKQPPMKEEHLTDDSQQQHHQIHYLQGQVYWPQDDYNPQSFVPIYAQKDTPEHPSTPYGKHLTAIATSSSYPSHHRQDSSHERAQSMTQSQFHDFQPSSHSNAPQSVHVRSSSVSSNYNTSSVAKEGQNAAEPMVPVADDTAESSQQERSTSNTRSSRSLRKRTPVEDTNGTGSNASVDSSSVNGSVRGSKAARRKDKDSDGRWSKRFTWPEELHRDFVSAVFDVGLKHSSPSAILEQMGPHEQLTSERIKSHLQKYRLYRSKSKKEFMASYDSSLNRMQKKGLEDVKSLSAGEVASYATYSIMKEDTTSNQQQGGNTSVVSSAATVATGPASPPRDLDRRKLAQDTIILPRLTESEKRSPIGASMGYLMGLFFSLRQQLLAQRTAKQASEIAAHNKGRTHIEESSKMKREMQDQMNFQNKMRALKQQELNKYKEIAASSSPTRGEHPHQQHPMHDHMMADDGDYTSHSNNNNHQQQQDNNANNLVPVQQYAQQGVGENASAEGADKQGRDRSLSIANTEEFWNNDIVDDQLFEFLMSDG